MNTAINPIKPSFVSLKQQKVNILKHYLKEMVKTFTKVGLGISVVISSVAHAGEIIKVDLGFLTTLVNLPSLLSDCVVPVPYAILPSPYENVTGNGKFSTSNGLNFYSPMRELQPSWLGGIIILQ